MPTQHWRLATRSRLAVTLGLLACGFSPALQAEDPSGGRTRIPLLPLYQQECSACHLAFPPQGLPAASWARLMQQLPQHFGTDASLDPSTVREISRWLQLHAASDRRAAEAPPEDRLTRSVWFLREHDEIPAGVWQGATVRKASNCAACHPGAAQGRFSEHELRMPR